jgi:drug/metabolite transporter (DMT)-like permease
MADARTAAIPWKELALLGLLALLWGSSFALIKLALADLPPATLVLLRTGVGALVLWTLARARGLQWPRRRWPALLLLGLLQSALPFSLISWGELHLPSGLAGLLNATVPIFVFSISVFVLGSAPFAWARFAGVLLGFAGVAVIAGVPLPAGSLGVLAVVAVLAASLSYACGALFGHRFSDQPALVTAAASLTASALLMLPIALALDRPWTLRPGPQALLAALALALLSTALASVIFFRLIRTLGSLATTSNAYLRALVSVAIGVLFLGEPLGWPVLAATGLVVGGLVLVTRPAAAPARS